MNEYRHVCFKDLNNYFRKDDYLGGLTNIEKQQIRNNINAVSSVELDTVRAGLLEDSYENIKQLVTNNKLSLNCKYIINDFQTIYTLDGKPEYGETYKVVLTAISSNQFDKRVSLMHQIEDETWVGLDWIVNYNFTSEKLENVDGEYYTKGKITYLQDSNNNSAFYDFKNIKYLRILPNTLVTGADVEKWYYLYTFSKIDSEGKVFENSEQCSNNQFDWDCHNNVFLSITNNNHFAGGFKNNTFIKECRSNNFMWNTFNNLFISAISHTTGTVQNAKIERDYDECVSKEFLMVGTSELAEPKFVVTSLDGDTLTTQVISLNKNEY